MAASEQEAKTLQTERFYHMLESGLCSDTTFLVGEEEQKIEAHRFMVMSASPEFEEMLRSTNATDMSTLRIPDMLPDVYREMLTFIYTEKCDITKDNVVHLIFASTKFHLTGLGENCRTFLLDQADTG